MSVSMTMKIQSQDLSSSLKIDEETMTMQKQGIVTILGFDCDTNTASASSLRRTLSADMSSNKWLPQKGSSPMKKIASSEELLHSKTIPDHSFSSSSEEDDDDDYEETKELKEAEAEAEKERLEIWSSIQRNKKEEQEKAGPFDMWSSIMSLKANDEISKSLPVTPYVHPLVKRSKSCLSEKSLEICTESLGSETGSDGLIPSYPPSEIGDAKEDKEEKEQQQQQEKVKEPAYEEEDKEEEFEVPRNNYVAATKKSPPHSFPPPLPSLSSRQVDPSLHMRPHRDNGRLVLEAVSLPSMNNFCVQRQDGRLVLTFQEPNEDAEKEENDRMEELSEEDDDQEGDKDDEEEEDVGDDDHHDDDEEGEEEEGEVRDVETVIEKAKLLPSGIGSAHRLTLVMNKPIGLVNRNPKWSEKFNEVNNFEDVNVVEQTQMVQSLPPRPRVARLIPSASFNLNAYEYYWRTKPTTKAANPLPHHQKNNNNNSTLQNNSSKITVSGNMNQNSNEKQVLVLRGKNGDYLVHNLKSCKDYRRSFMFLEPYCIATS
ncbi:protein FAF-like, chloroplastic [Gastrolobium bilobum]|uniref:protein FAF-like, chloroplastic n=1 Tax=Gastrolobium bilobum TaxID=150636 RepID=UPI002AAFC5CD|nr:protein FAF-like, chloroplastic [Gastrolobium bilobum]